MCISLFLIPTRPLTFDEICLRLSPSRLPGTLLRWLPASHRCPVPGLPRWGGTGRQAAARRASTASELCKKLSDLRVPPQSSTRGKGSAGAWGRGERTAGNEELAVVNAPGMCWGSVNASAFGETIWFGCGWRLSWEKGAALYSRTTLWIAFWMCAGVCLSWISDFLGYSIL